MDTSCKCIHLFKLNSVENVICSGSNLTCAFLFCSCRFHSVAYLQQIRCFEVVGEIDFSFPVLTYSLYFRIHLGRFYKRFGRRACSTEHVHGWDQKPVRFQLSTSNGQHSVFPGWARELGTLPCWQFCGLKAWPNYQAEVLDGADWLHTHKRWSLCRLGVHIPKGLSAGEDGEVSEM